MSDPDRNAQMASLYRDAKWSMHRIGAHFGLTPQRVQQVMVQMGVKRRDQRAAQLLSPRALKAVKCALDGCDRLIKPVARSAGRRQMFCSAACARKAERKTDPVLERAAVLVARGYGYQRALSDCGVGLFGKDMRTAVSRLCAYMRLSAETISRRGGAVSPTPDLTSNSSARSVAIPAAPPPASKICSQPFVPRSRSTRIGASASCSPTPSAPAPSMSRTATPRAPFAIHFRAQGDPVSEFDITTYEEAPSPTCHLPSSRCAFMYGVHRCERPAQHEGKHVIVLEFENSACPPVHPPAVHPERTCAECEYDGAAGCGVWPLLSARDPSRCWAWVRR